MKHRNSVTILVITILMVTLGLGCKSARQSKVDGESIAQKTRTPVTKDILKARLAGTKVKFIEKDEDLTLGESGEVARRELRPLTLKIVSVENEPNVEFMKRTYKLHEFSRYATDVIRDLERVTFPATESDIAFYNNQGIAIEDFELVIRELDKTVKEFAVDFLGQPSPTVGEQNTPGVSDKPKTTIETSIKDAEPPPLAKTPSSPSDRPPVSGGDMTNRAVSRVEPTYSPAARKVGASGLVLVKILVDEDGKVVSASPVAGHPLLYAATVAAVRQWKFSPAIISGQRVKTTGTVRVIFKP
jgi:TonB family protein